MAKPARRDQSLSRDTIIQSSIELLDGGGEAALTFRALAQRLATGPGAIYWHVADKVDLLTAACDAVLARTLAPLSHTEAPADAIRTLALVMFDAIDAHPWLGSALRHAPGQLPVVRILERLGQQVCALGVPPAEHWVTASALLNYILGVGGQNAANSHHARTRNLDRGPFLQDVARVWSGLDPEAFPFTRSVAAALPTHDDRADYLAGIDFILRGLQSVERREVHGTKAGKQVPPRRPARP